MKQGELRTFILEAVEELGEPRMHSLWDRFVESFPDTADPYVYEKDFDTALAGLLHDELIAQTGDLRYKLKGN